MVSFYTSIEALAGPDHTFIRMKTGELAAVQHQFEYALMLYAWRRSRGNQSQASRILGCNRNTFRKLKALHGITREDLPSYMQDQFKIRIKP